MKNKLNIKYNVSKLLSRSNRLDKELDKIIDKTNLDIEILENSIRKLISATSSNKDNKTKNIKNKQKKKKKK